MSSRPIAVKERDGIRSLQHPEWLRLQHDNGRLTCGPDQSWYEQKGQRLRGCGPTTAALISSYIARRPGMVSLFSPYRLAPRQTGSIPADYVYTEPEMRLHMKEMWRFVKPSQVGTWYANKLRDGLLAFAASRGVKLEGKSFRVKAFRGRKQKQWSELLEFIEQQLTYDIPLAFLLYDRGKLNNVGSWHWVTVTGIHYRSDFSSCLLQICDHFLEKEINLLEWYKSSKLGGAFVSFRILPGGSYVSSIV